MSWNQNGGPTEGELAAMREGRRIDSLERRVAALEERMRQVLAAVGEQP